MLSYTVVESTNVHFASCNRIVFAQTKQRLVQLFDDYMLEHGSFQFSYKLMLGLHLKLQWKADIRNPFDAFLESFEEKKNKLQKRNTKQQWNRFKLTGFMLSRVPLLLFQTFYTCVWCLVLETGDFIFKIPNLCADQWKMHMKENIVYLRLNNSAIALTFDNRRTDKLYGKH